MSSFHALLVCVHEYMVGTMVNCLHCIWRKRTKKKKKKKPSSRQQRLTLFITQAAPSCQAARQWSLLVYPENSTAASKKSQKAYLRVTVKLRRYSMGDDCQTIMNSFSASRFCQGVNTSQNSSLRSLMQDSSGLCVYISTKQRFVELVPGNLRNFK